MRTARAPKLVGRNLRLQGQCVRAAKLFALAVAPPEPHDSQRNNTGTRSGQKTHPTYMDKIATRKITRSDI